MTSATTKARIDWVDAGRGLAITLVVLFHATNWLGEAGIDDAGWSWVNDTIASLRLPLFFTMAGLFAQKWMIAPWSALWRSKISLYVWVYAIWSIIATFTFMLGLNLQGAEGNYLAQLRNLLVAPFLPRFELWFIWALAVFFVVAKLIRRLPIAVQLVGSAALSVVALSDVFVGNTGWTGMAKYFFFFLCGLLLRASIVRWSTTTRPLVLVAVFGIWAALALTGAITGWAHHVPGYYFVSCVVGVGAGIAVSHVLVRVPGSRYLGARTLPIYLTHTSVILVVVWLLWHIADLLPGPVWGTLLPPLVSAVAITVSLLLARAVRGRSPWYTLYEQPHWLSGDAR